MYLNMKSEEVAREILVKRHPRSAFTLATKLPTFIITQKEQVAAIFEEQFKHCGVDYFDYYLLHNIQNHTYINGMHYIGFMTNGAYAEKFVGRAKNACRLPENVSDTAAGLMDPLMVALTKLNDLKLARTKQAGFVDEYYDAGDIRRLFPL